MEEQTPTVQTRVVREIFTTSHKRYDLLNHLLSFRQDLGWRAVTVGKMRFERTMKFLDVATGTADLAIAAARLYPNIHVTGLDFAAPRTRLTFGLSLVTMLASGSVSVSLGVKVPNRNL
jgi:demethylmenaquinone methyltransferase/2-methoxy-6-polyprenyl-1,4-benzoquinol methylase